MGEQNGKPLPEAGLKLIRKVAEGGASFRPDVVLELLGEIDRLSAQLATARKGLERITGDGGESCDAAMCAPLRRAGIDCDHDVALDTLAAIDEKGTVSVKPFDRYPTGCASRRPHCRVCGAHLTGVDADRQKPCCKAELAEFHAESRSAR